MKKIFTLIAVAAMAMGVNAQTVIYSWEGGDESATETGGTVTANGSNTAVSASVITVSAKKADIATNNVTITLNQALAANDVISITGYRKKDTDANGNLYFDFGQGTPIDEGDAVTWNNIHENVGQQPNTNTYTITDQAGSTVIKLARSKASTNVFITKFVITRGGSSNINTVKAVEAEDSAAYNLAGQKVADGFKGIVVKNGRKMIQK